MLSKVLISCTFFVAAQAGYAQSGYGAGSAQNGGYAAFGKPRATIQVFPAPSYAGYVRGYGGSYGGNGGSSGGSDISAPLVAAAQSHNSVSSLAGSALSLPSPSLPNADVINVPKHAITSYSAPAVVFQSGAAPGGLASASNAAIAASNVKSGGSGYGPSQASGYGHGSAGSGSYGGSAAY